MFGSHHAYALAIDALVSSRFTVRDAIAEIAFNLNQ